MQKRPDSGGYLRFALKKGVRRRLQSHHLTDLKGRQGSWLPAVLVEDTLLLLYVILRMHVEAKTSHDLYFSSLPVQITVATSTNDE